MTLLFRGLKQVCTLQQHHTITRVVPARLQLCEVLLDRRSAGQFGGGLCLQEKRVRDACQVQNLVRAVLRARARRSAAWRGGLRWRFQGLLPSACHAKMNLKISVQRRCPQGGCSCSRSVLMRTSPCTTPCPTCCRSCNRRQRTCGFCRYGRAVVPRCNLFLTI